ncbi:unnamed protein product [Rhizopus stolonifer]
MNNVKDMYIDMNEDDMSENHTKVGNTKVNNTTTKNTKTKVSKASNSTKTSSTKTRSAKTRSAKTGSAKTGSAKVDSTTNKNEQNSKKGKPKNLKKHSSSPLPIINEEYSLSFVIEGHTNINIPVRTSRNKESNQSKDIWCCDFEPHRPGQVQTDVAALAGSYTVLFLDVQQGRYTKKYTHSETQEIFYSMAWTTVNTDDLLDENGSDENKSCNVLAVAGRLGSIKLLNPLQNECYRYLFGHNGPILKMVFSKCEPRWLFSASADKTVLLWDIGSPTSETDDSICLAKFALPLNVGQPSALSVSYDLSTIVVGCSDGNLVRFHLTYEQIELLRSVSEGEEKERMKTVHPEIIYPNGSEWHEGYVDDVHILGQDNGPKNALSNHIVSRGSEDREIVIWNAEKSKPDDIDIYKSLNWPDACGSTGLRYKMIEQNNQKVLIAGDYDGNVHLFDVGDGVKSKTLPDNSKEILDPFKVLSHEMSTEPIRDVACSMDTRSIVVVDTENHAFVWRC